MPINYNFSDVFISYAHDDRAFVRQITNALTKQGYEIWVDWEDIPQTVDWWNEIKAGIDAATTFLFFVSPQSAISQVCYDEVQYAHSNNKRIVPVLCEPIGDDLVEKLHPTIRMHNWYNFIDNEKTFQEKLEDLLYTMTMDVEYLRQHARYLVRAREWDERDRNTSFLLRGTDAVEAKRWLNASAEKSPKPLFLQKAYIDACDWQLEKDKQVEQQMKSLRFIERRTLPAFFCTFFIIWYYTWATIPASDLLGRARVEFGMGVAVTAGLIIAALVLMGDELVLLRYKESLILRSGYGFVFSLVLGGSIAGFLQAIFFGSRLEWISVFTVAVSYGLSTFLRATFRLNVWISFLIAFASIFIGINLTYATPETINTIWRGSRIPLYFFENDIQAFRLGLVMAIAIAFGYYGFELIQSIVRRTPKGIRETQAIRAILD